MPLIDPYSLVAQALDCPKENLDTHSCLGVTPSWDSFGYLQILMAMETEYGITIDEQSVDKYKKIVEILKLYEGLPNE